MVTIKAISIIALFLLTISMASASTFNTKVELELSSLTGISQLDNSAGDSVKVTIQLPSGSSIVSRNAAAGIYDNNMSIAMVGDKFSLSYAIDYVYNLSTIYGDFLYNFTTPAEPVAGGAELHTGQTTSYGTAPDDADYDGTPKSYTDNGCGTGTVLDDHTGLCWQKSDSGSTKNWEDAKSYCDILTLAEKSDWRLPSVLEGITMLDYGCAAAGGNCYSDFQNNALTWSTTTSYYWTSTTRPVYAGSAYKLYVDNGNMYSNDKSNNYYVRCVRSE